MKYDIVSIGDCTIDAFLEINKDEPMVHTEIKKDRSQLCFSFGDKIPYESLTLLSAGNANNVAVGMSRLGFKSAFYGTVGNDHNSHVILHKLHAEKVSTEFISAQKGMQTNFHTVLWYRGERTILIKHQPYKYKIPKAMANTSWVYLTSVGPKGLALHPQIEAFLKKNKKIRMSFNPGTFQLRMGVKKLIPLFRLTEILFLNKEEAQLMVGNLGGDIYKLSLALHKLGPKVVVITDGLKGSYAFAGGEFYTCGIYPHHPIEATGAGDAFATAFTAAVMQGLPVSDALRWGARNGASVAEKIGPQAGLTYKAAMLRDLKAHKNFKAKMLTK
jgi:ribokinase